MSDPQHPTTLGCAILGLLSARAQTGYEIARAFADTPMGTYSSSPGAIYPAIKRLKAAGLVKTEPAGGESSKAAFAITQKGKRVFLDWLRAPVTREAVARDMRDLMLRFAFMSGALPDAEIRGFLIGLEAELAAHVKTLDAYVRGVRAQMPPSAALALDAGVEGYRADARWAQKALAAFGGTDHEAPPRGGRRRGE